MERILVASPVEPSGGSWLLNCFLELGIRIGHKPVVDRIWRGSMPPPDPYHIWMARNDGACELNPKAGALKKFLPTLSSQACFRFRDDVDVEYVQDFPLPGADPVRTVLVVRDLRDAIYSMYRRTATELSFAEFLDFPNADTLLARPAHWALFVACWLAVPNVHVLRFEDYKRDAETTLYAVLSALGLHFTASEIARAVRLSSFERARDAERAVREQFPGDRQVANRSGKVGEGRTHPDVRPLITRMEQSAGPVMKALGYETEAPTSGDPFEAARVVMRFLSFFQRVRLPAEMSAVPDAMPAADSVVFPLLRFAHRLDDELVRRAGLPSFEARALHDSLAELVVQHGGWLAGRLAAGRENYRDGSAYFFQRIKQMRQENARIVPPPPES